MSFSRLHLNCAGRKSRGFVALVAAITLSIVGCAAGEASVGPSGGLPLESATLELACHVPENVSPVGKVVIGHETGTFSEPYVQWGIEQGCFSKYGVEVESVSGTSQAARVAGLVGGSLDVVIQVPRILIVSMVNGDIEPLVVSAHYEMSAEKIEKARAVREFEGVFYSEQALVSSPQSRISSLRDLSGARVSVLNARGNEVIGISRALVGEGLDPDTLEFVELDYQQAYNALIRGDLDAASLTAPLAVSAMEEGGNFLGHTTAHASLPGVYLVWITVPATYEKNGPAIRAFRDAMWEIYRLFEEERYRSSMIDFLVERYDLGEEMKYIFPLPDFTARQVTLEELQQWVPELISRGDIDRQVVLDSSILMGE